MAAYGYLVHHGIKGQKWGIRRFQKSDGTLTAEGRARYGISSMVIPTSANDFNKEYKQVMRNVRNEYWNDLGSVIRNKSLSKAEKKLQKSEIRKAYIGSGKVVMDTFKKKYGEEFVKFLINANRVGAASKFLLGTTILAGGAALTKNIVKDFDIIESDRRHDYQKAYTPAEVLKYELL